MLHELVDLADQPKELLMYFVADLVRKLHAAAAMLQAGARPFDICRQLRVWGDRQDSFVAAARKLGVTGAARLLGVLVEMDRRSKRGFGEPVRNLERFCVLFVRRLR